MPECIWPAIASASLQGDLFDFRLILRVAMTTPASKQIYVDEETLHTFARVCLFFVRKLFYLADTCYIGESGIQFRAIPSGIHILDSEMYLADTCMHRRHSHSRKTYTLIYMTVKVYLEMHRAFRQHPRIE